ncbi:DEAD/DEAH box helicase family protein [Paraburkholderia sp. GAS42]|uniref:DEAD/DEAH box helicase family protein n=1 Tax=Paraburkholderia sp. GAS42 TaxID=3035135 RepID=UPI003D25AD64
MLVNESADLLASSESASAIAKARASAKSVGHTLKAIVDTAPKLPVFADPWSLPKVDIGSASLYKHLEKLLPFAKLDITHEGVCLDAAALAWSICIRHCNTVPVKTSVDAIISGIRWTGAPLHPDTLAAMQSAIETLVDKRKREALAHVSTSPEVLARHDHVVLDKLPELTEDDYAGGIVLWAPMASGKTRHVIKPFAEWSRDAGEGRFVAVFPRQSLTREGTNVLSKDMPEGRAVAHYEAVDKEGAFGVDLLGTCLPSITKESHAQIMGECKYLVIDELTQNLGFIPADMCRTKDGDNQDVYFKLKSMIGSARCFMVADADMNDRAIAFLEKCRPEGERLKIFEVRKAAHKMPARLGHDDRDHLIQLAEASAFLEADKPIIFACETVNLATDVEQYLRDENPTKKILRIDGDNSGHPDQAAFLADAENESRKWDAVIHTPVISSGLSITHKVFNPETGRDECVPHFHHAFFVGNGHAIKPSDALQMMRRVRYVTGFTVVTMTNNRRGGINDADELLDALEDGARLEHRPDEGNADGGDNEFNRFVADEKTTALRARVAQFAAGLRWIMEYDGFALEAIDQTEQQADRLQRDMLAEKYDERVKAAILAARDLEKEGFDQMDRAGSRTEEELAELRRYWIKARLGADALDHDDVWDAWLNGSGVKLLDLFMAAVDGRADTRNQAVLLAHRKFNAARVRGLGYLFDGDAVKLSMIRPGMFFTQDMADEIVNRAIAKRKVLSAIGVVPESMGEGATYTPPEGSMRLALSMFRRMGLKFDRVDPVNGIYAMKDESFLFMRRWADMRREAIGIGARVVDPLVPAAPTTLDQTVCDVLHQFGGGDLPGAISAAVLLTAVNERMPEDRKVGKADELAKPLRLAGMARHGVDKKRVKWNGKMHSVWVIANTKPSDAQARLVMNEGLKNASREKDHLLHISPVLKNLLKHPGSVKGEPSQEATGYHVDEPVNLPVPGNDGERDLNPLAAMDDGAGYRAKGAAKRPAKRILPNYSHLSREEIDELIFG